MTKSKHLKNSLEFAGLKFLTIFVRIFPYGIAVRFSKILSFLAFSVIRIRRDVTIRNIQMAFPEKDLEECTALAGKVYNHFGRVAVDFLYMALLIPKRFFKLVQFENETVLQKALQAGKGVVLNGGHLGNWEFLAAGIPLKGYPENIIVGAQRNNLADAWFNTNRALAGCKIIHVGGAVRKSLKALNRGEVLAILSDQDAGKDGQFVPYFGRPASAPVGAALLSLRSGAPMIYAQAIFNNGRYRIQFERIRTDDLEGPAPENLWELTRRFTEILEKNVRKYPEQWFWMHRRWKTRPVKEDVPA